MATLRLRVFSPVRRYALETRADATAPERERVMMQKQMKAEELRHWAEQCASQADDPNITAGDRERLLKMNKALLELAQADDWLNGEGTMVEFVLPDEGESERIV